jgi:hypothetical protein
MSSASPIQNVAPVEYDDGWNADARKRSVLASHELLTLRRRIASVAPTSRGMLFPENSETCSSHDIAVTMDKSVWRLDSRRHQRLRGAFRVGSQIGKDFVDASLSQPDTETKMRQKASA